MTNPPSQTDSTRITAKHESKRILFHEHWWLDSVTNGNWGEQTAETKLGSVKFIYGIRRRLGVFTEIYLPPLSPYVGLHLDAAKPLSNSQKYKLLDDTIPILIKKLPRFSRLKINLSPEIDWWSPFYWSGFHQHTRYTYMLHEIKNHQVLWDEFNSNTKRNIKKAEKKIIVSEHNDVDILYSLFEKTMTNQSQQPGYHLATIRNIYREIVAHNAGTILIGCDESNQPHCALLLVWDSKYAYYLVGGTDPALRSSGAMPLTMWHAIKKGSEHADIFDFEGSMQKGIDKFLRGFGPTAVPYYCIGKGIFAGKIV